MALKFDLSDLNPPTWFEHPTDDETHICLRVLTGDELTKIRKQSTKRLTKFRRGQPYEKEVTNEDKQTKLTWEYCILDWKGIQDKDGEDIPCTEENKFILMQGAPEIAGWVSDCLEELNEVYEKKVESAEKN